MSTVEAGPIRTVVRKAGLRLALRARLRLASGDEKQAIDKCLGNRGAFDAVFDSLNDEYEAQAGGPLTDFLDWLMENLPAIIELIMKLLPLFV